MTFSATDRFKRIANQVDDLELVADRLTPIFPPDYKLFKFFESRYEKYLHNELEDYTADSQQLT